MSRRVFRQKGFSLLPCALLVAMVLLALTASLRTARQQLEATRAQADLLTARWSAEASLAEGERHLRTIVEAAPVIEASPVSGDAHPPDDPPVLSCAGASGEFSGYRLDALRADDRTELCRITATGAGSSNATYIRLQTEFELRACPLQREPAGALPLTALAKASEDAHASCRRSLHLRSWRLLSEV